MQKAIVMCGVPGSGKTVLSRELQTDGTVVVNYDDIRSILFGAPEIQGCWDEVWQMVEDTVAEAAGGGKDVILDGTHCKPAYRKDALWLLRSYGYCHVNLHMVDVPLEVAIEQNQQRKRQVPEWVIAKMYEDLQAGWGSIGKEGFSEVCYWPRDNVRYQQAV